MPETIFYTVLSATVVLVLGELTKSFLILPLNELHKLVGEIDYSLNFYADLYANPGIAKPEFMDEAKNVLRQQSSQLRARAYAVRLSWLRKDAIEASKLLMRLSNSIHNGDAASNIKDRERIKQLLRIKD